MIGIEYFSLVVVALVTVAIACVLHRTHARFVAREKLFTRLLQFVMAVPPGSSILINDVDFEEVRDHIVRLGSSPLEGEYPDLVGRPVLVSRRVPRGQILQAAMPPPGWLPQAVSPRDIDPLARDIDLRE